MSLQSVNERTVENGLWDDTVLIARCQPFGDFASSEVPAGVKGLLPPPVVLTGWGGGAMLCVALLFIPSEQAKTQTVPDHTTTIETSTPPPTPQKSRTRAREKPTKPTAASKQTSSHVQTLKTPDLRPESKPQPLPNAELRGAVGASPRLRPQTDPEPAASSRLNPPSAPGFRAPSVAESTAAAGGSRRVASLPGSTVQQGGEGQFRAPSFAETPSVGSGGSRHRTTGVGNAAGFGNSSSFRAPSLGTSTGDGGGSRPGLASSPGGGGGYGGGGGGSFRAPSSGASQGGAANGTSGHGDGLAFRAGLSDRELLTLLEGAPSRPFNTGASSGQTLYGLSRQLIEAWPPKPPLRRKGWRIVPDGLRYHFINDQSGDFISMRRSGEGFLVEVGNIKGLPIGIGSQERAMRRVLEVMSP